MTSLDNLQNVYCHSIAIEEMLKEVSECLSKLQSASQFLKFVSSFTKKETPSTESGTNALRDFERAVATYSAPSETEVSSCTSNAIVMLYRSHHACELYRLFKSSIDRRYQEMEGIMNGDRLFNTTDAGLVTDALTQKRTTHITNAIQQANKLLQIRSLRKKLDSLKTTVEKRFSSPELELINLHLEKIGLDAQISEMNGRLLELNRLLEVRKEQSAQVKRTNDEISFLQYEFSRKCRSIKQLDSRNHELWLQLPLKANEALKRKTEMFGLVQRARQALEEVITSDLNRHFPPQFQFSMAPSIRPNVYNSLYNSPLYNKFCDILNLHKPYRRIDLVLHEVVSQVIQHWLCLEEKTFLHDAAVVSEEELRTLIDLFRRDASTQKKVGKSVKASLHRVLLLADSVKATNRWCAQMLDFS